jgi:hypothetical protein
MRALYVVLTLTKLSPLDRGSVVVCVYFVLVCAHMADKGCRFVPFRSSCIPLPTSEWRPSRVPALLLLSPRPFASSSFFLLASSSLFSLPPLPFAVFHIPTTVVCCVLCAWCFLSRFLCVLLLLLSINGHSRNGSATGARGGRGGRGSM